MITQTQCRYSYSAKINNNNTDTHCIINNSKTLAFLATIKSTDTATALVISLGNAHGIM